MAHVTIYSTPGCTFCKMAKEYFVDNDVAFEEHDVSVDEEKRNEMVEKSGQLGVPVIVIGNELVIGFDEAKIEELLKNAESGAEEAPAEEASEEAAPEGDSEERSEESSEEPAM